MQISEAEHKAAGELVDLVAAKLGAGRAVHSETAIASCARLAGSLLLRSFELDIGAQAPGAVVLSNQANTKGQQLVGILAALLQHFGVTLDREKLGGEPLKRGAAPQLSIVESLALLQEDAMRITQTHGLAPERAAVAAAMATAFITKECAGSIGAEVGFNIAAYGFIEGSKTVPPAVASEVPSPNVRPL